MDVAPGGVVGADFGGVFAVIHHVSGGVDDVDEGVGLRFEVVVDAGLVAGGGEGIEGAVEGGGVESGGDQLGQCAGLVDHVFFDGFAVANFEIAANFAIAYEGKGGEQGGQYEDVAKAKGHGERGDY